MSKLEQDVESNKALSELFRIASRPSDLSEMLEKCLAVLIKVSWLALLPKAGVFISEHDKSGEVVLRLLAGKNLDDHIWSRCSTICMGECLCGKAAQARSLVFASCIDHRHTITFPNMKPHGHYNIPILVDDNLLGVIFFYLPHGFKRQQDQEDFLCHAADAIGLAISLRRKEHALLRSNQELTQQKRTLDEHAIVSIADAAGNITYVNDKFCEISGFEEKELIGRNHRILKSDYHAPEFYENMWSTITSGKPWHGEIMNKRKDGSHYWVNATVFPFVNDDGTPFQYVAVRTDITAQKEIEQALTQAQSVAKLGSWTFNIQTDTLIWSPEIYRIFNVNPDTFEGTLESFFQIIHPDDLQKVQDTYRSSIEGNTSYDIEHRIIDQLTREVRWVHERCEHQRNHQGEVIISHGTVQDITERKLIQQEIEKLAMTDPLTGLANRNQFNMIVDKTIKLAVREKRKVALLLLDLDKFKPVNDTYGHPAGDFTLQNVAEIFKKNCRDTDLVARLGGDEFAILLVHPETEENIAEISNRIIQQVRVPLDYDGLNIQIGVSIGISVLSDDSKQIETLIEEADTVLYQSKDAGRNCFKFFSR